MGGPPAAQGLIATDGGLPLDAVAASDASPLKAVMAVPERQLILEALERSGWRLDAAARALGINRTTLYKKAKRPGMNLASLAPQR